MPLSGKGAIGTVAHSGMHNYSPSLQLRPRFILGTHRVSWGLLAELWSLYKWPTPVSLQIWPRKTDLERSKDFALSPYPGLVLKKGKLKQARNKSFKVKETRAGLILKPDPSISTSLKSKYVNIYDFFVLWSAAIGTI